MAKNPLLKGLSPVHPGAILREDVMPSLGKTRVEIASLLGISRQTLYDVLHEKQPITANLALRIGKLVGGGPDIWYRMQQEYDLRNAEVELADEIKAIPTLRAA